MIPSKHAHVYTAAATHPGMTGKNNEDRFAISAYLISEKDKTPSTFAIVADGVGGHNAGEIAAEIAVDTITNAIAKSDADNPQSILQNAIVQASSEIFRQSTVYASQGGMGSTCVCAWIIRDRLFIANVGDSRIYLIRNGAIYQLTKDHSWIQNAIDQGIVDPAEAKNHPRAHVINRYLGSEIQVIPDFHFYKPGPENTAAPVDEQGLKLEPEDIILLCCDGLTDVVTDDEILSIATSSERTQAIQALIDLANQRGGPDNITIIMLEVPHNVLRSKSQGKFPFTGNWRLFGKSCLITLLALGLLLGLSIGYLWYKTRQPPPTPTPTGVHAPLLSLATPSLSGTTPPEEERAAVTLTPALQKTPELATYTPWATSTQAGMPAATQTP